MLVFKTQSRVLFHATVSNPPKVSFEPYRTLQTWLFSIFSSILVTCPQQNHGGARAFSISSWRMTPGFLSPGHIGRRAALKSGLPA